MKPGYLLLSVLVLGLFIGIGCGKSGSKGKPKISLESITRVVQNNDSMIALFKLSNASGLNNGTFVAIRNRINQHPILSGDTVGQDTFAVPMPDFHSSSSAELRFGLPAQGFLNEQFKYGQNDTLKYKFFALTPDSVSTDTITSPQFVVLSQ